MNQNYPIQGLSVYDTWLPNVFANNRFYDFFSAEGDAYRHGFGIHLQNKFPMSAKFAAVSNHTYINTPREGDWFLSTFLLMVRFYE